MKKIFTLIAAVAMALTANAQLISFSEGDAAGDGKTFSNGNFSITLTDTDGKMAIDGNNATFGTAAEPVKFSYRLKSGGKSSSKNTITVNVPETGTLKVYVRTGSNSATDRTVILTQNGTELLNKVVKEADVTETIPQDDGTETKVYPIVSAVAAAGTVEITYPVGSMNFYGFEFSAGGEVTPQPQPGPGPVVEGEGALISFTSDDAAADGKSFANNNFSITLTDTDGKMSIDDNNATFGTAAAPVKFTRRLKSGGKSSSKNFITVNIPEAGTLKVYVRTGSNSATDRTVILSQNGTELLNKVVKEADVTETIPQDDGTETKVYPVIAAAAAAGTVEITYPVGSMNFYGFELVTATGVQTLKAETMQGGVMYNLAGQKVADGFKGIAIQNGKKVVIK